MITLDNGYNSVKPNWDQTSNSISDGTDLIVHSYDADIQKTINENLIKQS